MRVGSRTPATSQKEFFVTIVIKWEVVKNSHKWSQVPFESFVNGYSSFMRQLEWAQSVLECNTQMLQKKMRNNYKYLRIEWQM